MNDFEKGTLAERNRISKELERFIEREFVDMTEDIIHYTNSKRVYRYSQGAFLKRFAIRAGLKMPKIDEPKQ